MLLATRSWKSRRAAAVVETAAVASVFVLFLFGVMEYCRYIFVRQLIANAGREGARYAVVNSNSPTLDADTQAFVRAKMGGMDTKAGVKNFVVQVYTGTSTGAQAFSYNASGSPNYAYQVDASGNPFVMDSSNNKMMIQKDAGGSYLVDPKAGNAKVYVTLDSVTQKISGVNAAAFSNLVKNNQVQGVTPASDAAFGTYIVVEIDCDYDPVLPVLLLMPSTLHINNKTLMYSEAN